MVFHDRPLIGPPLLDDRTSSTIEHDIMRLVREWMVGGRLPPGTSSSRARRAHGETAIRVLPLRRSSILRQLCDRLSQPHDSKKEVNSQTAA